MTDPSDFEARQTARGKTLNRLTYFARVLSLTYLAAHAAIAWHALSVGGVLVGLATFLALGLGDLYWAAVTLRTAGHGGMAALSLVATGLFLAAWYCRRRVSAWAMSFAIDMLEDFAADAPENGDNDGEASADYRHEPGVGDRHG